MKITIKKIQAPMITEFALFEPLKISELKESPRITVTASHETKTYISSAMQFKSHRSSICSPSTFKTKSKKRMTFSGSVVESHYFVKSKKQGEKEYIEHIKEILQHHFSGFGIEELEVGLISKVQWA